MKTLKLLLVSVVCFTTQLTAQTVDEILANYYENIGGKEKLAEVKGMRMSAKVNQGGMEIPIEVTTMKDGRQMTIISFQGLSIKQGVFDGKTLWSTNFMTQKAEKSDQETTDMMKQESGDFPDAFFDYKKKGYKVELLEKETIEGTEYFKIKLTKKPVIIDGKEEDNVTFYFFDTENFLPLIMHSKINQGPMKGQVAEVKMSDYQEVDGLYFPFSMGQGVKGGNSETMTFDKIELNPEVKDSDFAFPEDDIQEEIEETIIETEVLEETPKN